MSSLTNHIEPLSSQNELGEAYAAYKQLVLALAAGMIFDHDLSGVADHAALLSERCAVALAAADPDTAAGRALAGAALAAAELGLVVGMARSGSADAEAGIAWLRQGHRALRRQVWAVLPFDYPSCASEHAYGGPHAPGRNPPDRSADA